MSRKKGKRINPVAIECIQDNIGESVNKLLQEIPLDDSGDKYYEQGNISLFLNGKRSIPDKALDYLSEISGFSKDALTIDDSNKGIDKVNKLNDITSLISCVLDSNEINDFELLGVGKSRQFSDSRDIEFSFTYKGKKKSYSEIVGLYNDLKRVVDKFEH